MVVLVLGYLLLLIIINIVCMEYVDDYVLGEIFSHLSSSDLYCSVVVCKRWGHLIQQGNMMEIDVNTYQHIFKRKRLPYVVLLEGITLGSMSLVKFAHCSALLCKDYNYFHEPSEGFFMGELEEASRFAVRGQSREILGFVLSLEPPLSSVFGALVGAPESHKRVYFWDAVAYMDKYCNLLKCVILENLIRCAKNYSDSWLLSRAKELLASYLKI